MHQSLTYSQFREGDSFPYVCDDVICLIELKLTFIFTHILRQIAIWPTGCIVNLNTHYLVPDTILVLASFNTSVSRLKFWNINVISPTLDNGCNYWSMLELKLIHVSKIGPWMNDLVIISLNINVEFHLQFTFPNGGRIITISLEWKAWLVYTKLFITSFHTPPWLTVWISFQWNLNVEHHLNMTRSK